MTFAFDVTGRFTDAAEEFTVSADLTVERGETLVILGPSGAGKSLLLQLLAGFHPVEGEVRLDGEDITTAPPEAREFGMVFQEQGLFPHMSVEENVSFGTRYHDRTREPLQVLDSLNIRALADRSPEALSGGERQRVALARALVIRPRVFLLDEPLSALDVPTREALRGVLVDLLGDETAIHVTHDRTTARALADRIAVISDGRIRQVGTPDEVFDHPRSAFVARFTGSNVIPRDALPEATTTDVPTGPHLAVRPEDVIIENGGDIPCRIDRVIREDATYRATLAIEGTTTTVDAFLSKPPHVDSPSIRFRDGSLTVVRTHGEST